MAQVAAALLAASTAACYDTGRALHRAPCRAGVRAVLDLFPADGTMALSWVLLDTQRDVYLDRLTVGPAEVRGAPTAFSVTACRLHGGARDGVDLIEIHNGACRLVVLPTRGMNVWRAWVGEVRLGWDAPVHGPVHPRQVPLMEPGGLGWLDGFDELVARCGLESVGPPVFDEQGRLLHPLHGRISNTPAHYVELGIDEQRQEIRLTGIVDEARLFFNRLRLRSTVVTRFGEPGFTLHDEVQNLSAEASQLQLLYHINFGPPLLEAGSKLLAPVREVVPRTPRAAQGVATWHTYRPPQTGFGEEVFYFDLIGQAASDGQEGVTQVVLHNAAADLGVSLHFDKRQLPHFVQWKCTQALQDAYVTGLEPAINFPNPRPFEAQQGRVRQLAAGQSVSFAVRLQAHVDRASVAEAQRAIAALQGDIEPRVHLRPALPWTPEV
jgi:hypothetical protein